MLNIIDGRPHLRPCLTIAAEATDRTEWGPTPIAEMYSALTTELPLAGANGMTRLKPSAEPRLTSLLREEAPWMAPALDRIAEQINMRLWAGRPWLKLRPLMLVGPPGGGKSYLARRLGELSGCGSAIVSLAGAHSSCEVAGNPRGYKHPQPCFAACTMQRTQTANPVIVVDEVDKASVHSGGDPVNALLNMTEPATADRFYDGCLASEIDLSEVNWVLTANSVARLPAPLLSRVDVVEVPGPGPEHAEQLLAQVWRSVARSIGLPPSALPSLAPRAEAALIQLFRRTRSVRRVRRAVEATIAVSVRHHERQVS
jgi:ATP-dependent Lon protease